ncbi:esterase-like activity of phytase family protein [Nocardia sp. BSTN01]|uniref:esterase-like activity of phytase family protein n=1 Tax=Nocardia sp. BSTN01 TaxID=2783665 RepID=UPI00188FF233|nr:esterase-like activity of phytase family protein [Nocardia sp. BSTN01]MBF5001074.1 esterase-like activity of phytase family protein [Nocardia sp. BSTN01]
MVSLPSSVAGTARADNAPLAVRYVNSVIVSDETMFGGQKVGGLSGIDYDSAKKSSVAISDNRGEEGPVRAYTLQLPIDATGRVGQPQFELLSVTGH